MLYLMSSVTTFALQAPSVIKRLVTFFVAAFTPLGHCRDKIAGAIFCRSIKSLFSNANTIANVKEINENGYLEIEY